MPLQSSSRTMYGYTHSGSVRPSKKQREREGGGGDKDKMKPCAQKFNHEIYFVDRDIIVWGRVVVLLKA